jgi:AraC-like DNA-binding protein
MPVPDGFHATGVECRVFRPRDERLAPYLECIYLMKRPAGEFPVFRYHTFPSPFTIVCSGTGSAAEVTGDRIVLRPSAEKEVVTGLVSGFSKPVLVEYHGPINEITLYFKPLGLNAFLEKDLQAYSGEHLSDFRPYLDYAPMMQEILALESDEEQVNRMEAYWLSKLRGFEHPFLHRALHLLAEAEAGLSITEIAQRLGISRVTFNKHFERHLDKTPAQFRKILRFRKALGNRGLKQETGFLTDLAHRLDYFDQSHMVRDFKALTGYSPRTVFSKLSPQESGPVRWLIL